MVSVSEMPSLLIIAPNCSGPGSMCGRSIEVSATASMSKNTAPGMWPARYSARASRFSVGRKYVPSTTVTLPRLSASHCVDFSRGLAGCDMICTIGLGQCRPSRRSSAGASSRRDLPRRERTLNRSPPRKRGPRAEDRESLESSLLGFCLRGNERSVGCAFWLHQREPHAAVQFALLLDLRHLHLADLAGGAHVGAAAGLQIEAGDLDQADAAGAHRRLHRHGLDQAGIGFELGVADPARR